jgi:hypothetical protein
MYHHNRPIFANAPETVSVLYIVKIKVGVYIIASDSAARGL